MSSWLLHMSCRLLHFGVGPCAYVIWDFVTHSYEFVKHFYVISIVKVGVGTYVHVIRDSVTHAYQFVMHVYVVWIVAVGRGINACVTWEFV